VSQYFRTVLLLGIFNGLVRLLGSAEVIIPIEAKSH
jgi:hypothetical protein